MGRHPILTILLLVLFLGLLSRSVINERSENTKTPTVKSNQTQSTATQQPSGTLSATKKQESNPLTIPPPKFRVFKSKTDAQTTYIVAVDTPDEQLKSLLWLFREKVRAGRFTDIGITQPTAKQWGQYGYKSGMLEVYRGDKCANEAYISNAQLEKGNLGPCEYGEHDDAYYMWGVDADPNKDDAGIMTKNGNNVHVFDYKDNWHASSEVLQSQSEEEKEEWKVKQQEWEPRQRFAVQMTNTPNEKGLDVDASANEIDPKQLDFRSQLFKNTAFRESFLNKALPQIRRNLCNAGFRSIRILQESNSDAGQSYPLKCQ
jgi:hypothetical protein